MTSYPSGTHPSSDDEAVRKPSDDISADEIDSNVEPRIAPHETEEPMFSVEVPPSEIPDLLARYDARQEGVPLAELEKYRDDELKQKYRCPVSGYPDKNAAYLLALSEEIYEQRTVFPYVVSERDLRWYWHIQGPVTGRTPEGRSTRNIYGTGMIVGMPGKHISILKLTPRKKFARHCRYWWDLLRQRLIFDGIAIDDSSADESRPAPEADVQAEVPPRKPRKSGPKASAANDWLFDMVETRGRSVHEPDLQRDWLARRRLETGKKPADDPLDVIASMKEAIRRRRKRSNKAPGK